MIEIELDIDIADLVNSELGNAPFVMVHVYDRCASVLRERFPEDYSTVMKQVRASLIEYIENAIEESEREAAW